MPRLKKILRNLVMYSSFLILALDCISSEKRDMNLLEQDDNYAIFQLGENEGLRLQKSIFAIQDLKFIVENDEKTIWNQDQIQSVFRSTLVVQASLLSNSPSQIFSKKESYLNLSLTIAQRIELNKNSTPSPIYFVVIKENDDLAPFTKILRTSFYLFVEQGKIYIYFGEIRESISFLMPYTFSDWISSPNFTISQKSKSRITYIENKLIEGELLTTIDKNEKEFYLDAIKWSLKQTQNDKSNLSENVKNKGSKNGLFNPSKDPESRLLLLEDLKRKGLITIKEYQSKRKEILDEL